jgi:hypothetical protein
MPAFARVCALFAVTTACVALAASAADRRETRPVSGFTGIALSAPIKVQFTQADTESLTLEGDAAALAEIETIVEQGTLKIRPRSRLRTVHPSKVKAFVTAKTIEGLSISGPGDIEAPALKTGRLKISIAGSGDVRIGALASTDVQVAVSGSGDVTIGGKADTVSTTIAGSGDVRAGKLEARQAKVSIAGSGDVTLWAKEAIEVKIARSGDVRYYGDPSVSRSVAGAGSVRRAGAAPS